MVRGPIHPGKMLEQRDRAEPCRFTDVTTTSFPEAGVAGTQTSDEQSLQQNRPRDREQRTDRASIAQPTSAFLNSNRQSASTFPDRGQPLAENRLRWWKYCGFPLAFRGGIDKSGTNGPTDADLTGTLPYST